MRRLELHTALAAGLAFLMLSGGACRKEQPTDGDGGTPALSDEDIASAVELYINAAAPNSKGYFVVFDEEAQKEARLKPDRVNREMVGKVADNMFFARAEFVTDEGDIYDMDIFVTGESKSSLEFVEFMIHSVNGHKRYEWYTDGKLWKRKPVMARQRKLLEPRKE